jgi:hypothetical protein
MLQSARGDRKEYLAKASHIAAPQPPTKRRAKPAGIVNPLTFLLQVVPIDRVEAEIFGELQ